MIHSVTAVDIFTGELDSNGLLPSTCIFVKHLFLTVRCGREQGCRGGVGGVAWGIYGLLDTYLFFLDTQSPFLMGFFFAPCAFLWRPGQWSHNSKMLRIKVLNVWASVWMRDVYTFIIISKWRLLYRMKMTVFSFFRTLLYSKILLCYGFLLSSPPPFHSLETISAIFPSPLLCLCVFVFPCRYLSRCLTKWRVAR